MSVSSETVVLGTDYVTPKSVASFSFATHVAGAMTPGKKSCVREKTDGNEDAMAFYRLADGAALMVLADAHYGASSANQAVTEFPKLFKELSGDVARRSFLGHMALDERIRRHNQAKSLVSSTTFVSLHVKDDLATFCSSGDSFLMLWRDGKLRSLAVRHDALFLGDAHSSPSKIIDTLTRFGLIDMLTEADAAYEICFCLSQFHKRVEAGEASKQDATAFLEDVAKLSGVPAGMSVEQLLEPWCDLYLALRLAPVSGAIRLRSGDRLLLASDGLEERTSGLSMDAVAGLMSEGSDLEVAATTLVKKSLGRRGGMDNVALMLARFP